MSLTWRQRLTQQPTLRSVQNWPQIPMNLIPAPRRKGFVRNQRMVALALEGALTLKQIALDHHYSPGRLSQLLTRCLGGDEDQPPVLTQGLIPYQVVKDKQRQQPLPTVGQNGGYVGTFQALLKAVPALRQDLDAMIQAKLKDAPYAQRLSPQAFHGEFKRILAEQHWPQNCYPFTTVSCAYESVRRYLHQRMAELLQQRQQQRQKRPRNFGLTRAIHRALRAIQIDEHIVDLRSRIHLQLNDELIPLPVSRVSALVAIDVDTECVLGYTLTPSISPNQQDLLSLLEHCLQPWQPMDLKTPGLSYLPGAAFPSGLKNPYPISFGIVQLDNALMHKAHAIRDFLCEQCGATLSLGVPGMPKIRQLVESVFGYINQHCSHRMASTTGSHPTDPNKESRKNRKRPPLITFETLNEALSVILTEYNLTPQASLGHNSPLALFEHHCRTHYLRWTPAQLSQQWQPLLGSQVVGLHWYQHEHRAPHINFCHERYQGPGLLQVAANSTHIRILFDRKDIRRLQAFSLTGKDLGELFVSPPWRRFAHTMATRQLLHRLVRQARLNTRDPLSDYFRLLLEQKHLPKKALSLLKVYTEFTHGQSEGLVLGQSDHILTQALNDTHPPIWDPNMANHRE